MNKKIYQQPEAKSVKLQMVQMIAATQTSVTSLSNNASVLWGGASSNDTSGQGPRSRNGVWFDDDEDEF